MARGGYKFFDTDAHVGPYVDVLEPYLTAEDKTRLAGWEQYRATNRNGHVTYNKGQRIYQRRSLYRNGGGSSVPAIWQASPAWPESGRSRRMSTDRRPPASPIWISRVQT